MQEIVVDREFKELLPPLDRDTYRSLEENIIANGCMFPLVTWNNILIDGHNRHTICTEHEIPYKTVEKEFATREDVVIWIISNQVARRNLTSMQLTYFRGLHYNTVKLRRGAQPGNTQASKRISNNQTFVSEPATAQKLSNHYKVSKNTIFSDATATKAIDAIGKVSPEAKAKILNGDVSIDKKELQRLAAVSDEEIKDVALDIENDAYDKKKAERKKHTGNETGISELQAEVLHGDGITPGQISVTPTKSVIGTEVDKAYLVFSGIAARGTMAQIKTALSSFIYKLENLHSQI